MRTTFYRYFDKHGILLYVGITGTGMQRQRAHAANAPWWHLVETARYEHHHTLAAAARAELDAIRDEHPVWNKRHAVNGYWDFYEAVDRLNVLCEQPPPYTLEQIAHALEMRADSLAERLVGIGITPYRGRYSQTKVADMLTLFDDAPDAWRFRRRG